MDFLFRKLDDTNLIFKVISIQGFKFSIKFRTTCKKKPGNGCKRLFVAGVDRVYFWKELLLQLMVAGESSFFCSLDSF